MRAIHGLALALGCLIGIPPQVVDAQGSPANRANSADVPTQRDVARLLRSTEAAKRNDGLRMAQMVQPQFMKRDLRLGLFIALHNEADMHRTRLRSQPLDDNVPNRPVSRYHDELLTRVISLKDSTMIPVLANSLGTGMNPVRALVEFGRTASNATLRVTNDSASAKEQVADGLLTLRLMLENPGTRPLTPAGRSKVRNATLAHLHDPASRNVLIRAIDVAIVLGESDLRQIVSALASDDAAIRQRGITNPGDINKVKQHARDRLSGLPPMPRS